MTANTERRFYFQIRSANILEAITAHTLTEAKQIAERSGWLPWWSEIEWLTTDDKSHG